MSFFLNWEEPLNVWRRGNVSGGLWDLVFRYLQYPFKMRYFFSNSFQKCPPLLFVSDQALPGFSGGGRPSRRGEDGDGRDPAVRLDGQAATKADMERQVTQRTADFVPSTGPQKTYTHQMW